MNFFTFMVFKEPYITETEDSKLYGYFNCSFTLTKLNFKSVISKQQQRSFKVAAPKSGL